MWVKEGLMERYRTLGCVALVLATAALGCGDSGDDGQEGDDGFVPEGGFAMVPCPEGLLENFANGLQVMGEEERIQAELVDAQYVPARQYRNDWTVAFLNDRGEPLDDVEITYAQSFMPTHNHDGRFPPMWAMLPEPGQFQVDDINMWMPGPWEVQFSVSSASAGDDRVVFDVCIE
jgi:hypothetical protein